MKLIPVLNTSTRLLKDLRTQKVVDILYLYEDLLRPYDGLCNSNDLVAVDCAPRDNRVTLINVPVASSILSFSTFSSTLRISEVGDSSRVWWEPGMEDKQDEAFRQSVNNEDRVGRRISSTLPLYGHWYHLMSKVMWPQIHRIKMGSTADERLFTVGMLARSRSLVSVLGKAVAGHRSDFTSFVLEAAVTTTYIVFAGSCLRQRTTDLSSEI